MAKKGTEANLSDMMAVRARWAGAGQMIKLEIDMRSMAWKLNQRSIIVCPAMGKRAHDNGERGSWAISGRLKPCKMRQANHRPA